MMATRKARMRSLVLRMQAVLWARRMVRRVDLPPLVTALADVRLALAGVAIVDEMCRVEGATKGDAA